MKTPPSTFIYSLIAIVVMSGLTLLFLNNRLDGQETESLAGFARDQSSGALRNYGRSLNLDGISAGVWGPKLSVAKRLPAYMPGEVLVKFKNDPGLKKLVGSQGVSGQAVNYGLDVLSSVESVNVLVQKHRVVDFKGLADNVKDPSLRHTYKLELKDARSVETAIKDLKQDPNVEHVEPNYIYYTFFKPNDGLYDQQWAHRATDAEKGWDIERGKSHVVIGVIDTGINYLHEDLFDNMLSDCTQGCPPGTGYDFVDLDPAKYNSDPYRFIDGEDYMGWDNEPLDYYGHGTHCAGIAAATTNNARGIAGVCPGCKIMPLRAGGVIERFISDGYYEVGLVVSDAVIRSIYYATNNSVDILSMSFGGEYRSSILEETLDYANDNGVFLVAAAGNAGFIRESYPAAFSDVFSVASFDEDNQPSGFSNFGFWVDVAAPGGKIISTVPDGYDTYSGTSMAAPYVAGLAGLILSKNSNLNPNQLKDIIKQGVDIPGTDFSMFDRPGDYFYFGTGRVNVHKALAGISDSMVGGAVAWISSPRMYHVDPIYSLMWDVVSFGTEVRGSATGDSYILEIGKASYPCNDCWKQIGSGTQVRKGVLGVINIDKDGLYILRLTVKKGTGFQQVFMPVQVLIGSDN